MQLKYLKGDRHNVYGGVDAKAYPLMPVGEVPDSIAKALLRKFPDTYAVFVPEPPKVEEEPEQKPEPEPTFKCDLCGNDFASNAALGAHKRFKHKEIK